MNTDKHRFKKDSECYKKSKSEDFIFGFICVHPCSSVDKNFLYKIKIEQGEK